MITVATYITLLRIVLVAPLAWALATEQYVLALTLFALAAFTDFLDGYIARRYNQVSTLGAVLDPVADKLLILSTFTILSYLHQVIPAWFIIFIWLKELLLFVGSVIIFLRGDKPVAARISGKIAMASQVFYGLLLLPGAPVPGMPVFTRYTDTTATRHACVLLVVTLVTLYALLDYVYYFFKNKKL